MADVADVAIERLNVVPVGVEQVRGVVAASVVPVARLAVRAKARVDPCAMERVDVLLLARVEAEMEVFASAAADQPRSDSRSTQIACGSERREVKQLLDDDAVNVAFGHGIDSTVKRMGQLKRPAETGDRQKERRVYRVWGIFDSIPPSETSPGVKLGYKTEDNDNDIHLAIRDSAGATMVVEFPNRSCTPGAQHRGGMQEAREKLVKACSDRTPPRDPPKSFVELHGSARITGVLFFDFAHHQRGRAPNVAELHPVLRITNVECSRA